MTQLALIGLGKSGANLLPLVNAPCNLFLLGNVNFPEADSLSPI